MSRQSLRNVCRLLNDVQKETPVEGSFLADLQRSIELTADATTRMPSKTYKPSSMNCIRNMWYQRTGHEQDPTASTYALVGICNAGTDIHQRIQSAVHHMKDNNIDCEYVNVADYIVSRSPALDHLRIVQRCNFDAGDFETKLYNTDLNISFLCDGVIRYQGKYYILELKTESQYKWQTRNGVDPKHYAQGTAYSQSLGIPEVIFVYISRDNLTMKAFKFVPEQSMKDALVAKINSCEEYVVAGECPPKPEDVPKSACEYCAYRNACRSENNA